MSNVNKQLEPILRLLKRPPVIFSLAAILGLIPLALSVSTALWPAMEARTISDEQLAGLKAQVTQLEASPIPEPFNPDMAADWLKKVPLKEDHSEFILNLLALERDSGASIEVFQVAQAEQSMDEIIQDLEKAQAAMNPAAVDPKNHPDLSSGQPQPEEAEEEPDTITPEGIAAETLSLEAVGDYEEIVLFWKGLASMERIVSVTGWSLNAGSEAVSVEGQKPGTRIRLSLEITVYTATAFPELSTVQTEQTRTGASGSRNDPTLTNEAFYNMLEQTLEGER
ncbi:type 4a pilus biogenesis protein PilO [Paenibacillus sp. TRM 82003]|nr:type 4a pilus biogenesis protein PilO [Paenibacillus sp. TRM 82003]